jgi:hypothetical protein
MAEQSKFRFGPDPANSSAAAIRALTSAQRLGISDPSAGPAFADAERLAIKSPDIEVHVRVFESSGDFHERRKAFPSAIEKYNLALRSAKCVSMTSDEAIGAEYRIRYKLLRVHNRDVEALKNLERAAQTTDTYQARLKAWSSYLSDVEGTVGQLAARVPGSKDDFRGRLDAAKQDFSDEEDDEEFGHA